MLNTSPQLSANRTGFGKRCGIVVDYYGVANHLREAPAAYVHARARGRYKDLPQTQLSRSVNDRAKASEIEHAIRSHVRKHADEDPVLYRKRSEHLNELLKSMGEQWDQLGGQMQKIINELRSGQVSDDNSPLDLPEHYAPVLRTLLDVVCADANPRPAGLLRLKDIAVELLDLLVGELQSHRDIWSPRKRAAQEELAGQLFDHLMRLRPPLVDKRLIHSDTGI